MVSITAPAYSLGSINFEDINFTEQEYNGSKAYAQSKLALVLFSAALGKHAEGMDTTYGPRNIETDPENHYIIVVTFNICDHLIYARYQHSYFTKEQYSDNCAKYFKILGC